MTEQEAIAQIRAYGEDEGPDSYEEAAALFRAIYGRTPEAHEGDAGELFSLCCASLRA